MEIISVLLISGLSSVTVITGNWNMSLYFNIEAIRKLTTVTVISR